MRMQNRCALAVPSSQQLFHLPKSPPFSLLKMGVQKYDLELIRQETFDISSQSQRYPSNFSQSVAHTNTYRPIVIQYSKDRVAVVDGNDDAMNRANRTESLEQQRDDDNWRSSSFLHPSKTRLKVQDTDDDHETSLSLFALRMALGERPARDRDAQCGSRSSALLLL